MATARYMGLGIALGTGLGAAFHMLAMGIALGVATGAILSVAMHRRPAA